MNGVVLFFIGLPLVAGVIYRYKTFDMEHFKKSALISGAVFASVGVGYAFSNDMYHSEDSAIKIIIFFMFVSILIYFIKSESRKLVAIFWACGLTLILLGVGVLPIAAVVLTNIATPKLI